MSTNVGYRVGRTMVAILIRIQCVKISTPCTPHTTCYVQLTLKINTVHNEHYPELTLKINTM